MRIWKSDMLPLLPQQNFQNFNSSFNNIFKTLNKLYAVIQGKELNLILWKSVIRLVSFVEGFKHYFKNYSMHIGFLTPEYPHEKIAHAAGIGTSIKNLAFALIRKNMRVAVFVYGQHEDVVFMDNGIEIHLITNRNFKFFGWYLNRKRIEKYCNTIILKNKIHLIEAPDWSGITAFMTLKAPLVIRFHGSDTYFCCLENRKQKIKNFWFEKLGLKKAKAFIAPTDFAGLLTKQLFKIKNKTIQTIHYGLNLPQFKNNEPQVFENGLILYIGTIIKKKGVLELPFIFRSVLQKMPNSQLILIGSDASDIQSGAASTWQLFQELCTANELKKIKYLGKIPYNNVQHYINKAHICIFPTFAETLGMVTIEAMAMQKPVVNSNIGWANELIDDGVNGYLVHPSNHELYANKIVNLLNDKTLCSQIGTAARQKVEQKFDIDKIVIQNIEFYNDVIATINRP